MKTSVNVVLPTDTEHGKCVACAIAMQANDRVVPELLPDGRMWPEKPYPGDNVIFPLASAIYDHLLEHQRAGHEVAPELMQEALQLTRLSGEELQKIRDELTNDPKHMGYAGLAVQEQWHAFNCTLVPFHDELGNRVGYTSRANLLLRKGVRLEDVVMATYNLGRVEDALSPLDKVGP